MNETACGSAQVAHASTGPIGTVDRSGQLAVFRRRGGPPLRVRASRLVRYERHLPRGAIYLEVWERPGGSVIAAYGGTGDARLTANAVQAEDCTALSIALEAAVAEETMAAHARVLDAGRPQQSSTRSKVTKTPRRQAAARRLDVSSVDAGAAHADRALVSVQNLFSEGCARRALAVLIGNALGAWDGAALTCETAAPTAVPTASQAASEAAAQTGGEVV